MADRLKKWHTTVLCYTILIAQLIMTGWIISRMVDYFATDANVTQLMHRDFVAFILIGLLFKLLRLIFVGWNPNPLPFFCDLNAYEFFRKGKGEAAVLIFRTKRLCVALMVVDVFLMLFIIGIWGIHIA